LMAARRLFERRSAAKARSFPAKRFHDVAKPPVSGCIHGVTDDEPHAYPRMLQGKL
jgi:hypothetical protein